MTKPPVPLVVAYRLFAWRLGPTYQAWTYDDITRPGYPLRQAGPVALVVGALLAAVYGVTGSEPQRAIPPVLGVIALAAFLRKSLRERALRQQGLSSGGDADADWYDDAHARRRRNVTGALATATLVLSAVVLLAVRAR